MPNDPRADDEVRLIGSSPAIRAINEDIESAAVSAAKVLITGETGAGKEVIAKLIHRRSARHAAPLTTVNCAGVPDSLLESELFGHVRGSFTGAYRDKPGLFEVAANGTVFLDEVGEMTARMQAVLLRFLETGELQRVGADRPHARVNVRLIAATNRDLMTQVASGAFREDLYYRLNVIRICVPPLRERREDIVPLFSHFVGGYARHYRLPHTPTLTPAATELLATYHWPGNIRQLKNIAERTVLRVPDRPIEVDDLPVDIRPAQAPAIAARPDAPAQPHDFASPFLKRMLSEGESFWSAVYPAFMSRDLTRDTLRQIVAHGLQSAAGNYRVLVETFNMPVTDYKRFLSFLRKHDCHVPFKTFRAPLPASAGSSVSRAQRDARESFEHAHA